MVPPPNSPQASPFRWVRAGASRSARSGGVDALTAALRIGATGLVVQPQRSPEGEPVLASRSGGLLRRSTTVALSELWGHVGAAGHVAIDLSGGAFTGADEVTEMISLARAHGFGGKLWLLSDDAAVLTGTASTTVALDGVGLLHLTDPRSTTRGAEAHAAWLREVGLDGVMVPEEHTSGGLVALMHRFGRIVVADGADFRRTARRAFGNGVDGVCGSDAEALHDAWVDVTGGVTPTPGGSETRDP